MTDKEKLMKRKEEIKELLISFFEEECDEKIEEYSLKLLEKLFRKRTYSFKSGKLENWAGAIVCVIARLNFLFDKSNKNCLTMDTICDFFDAKKKTIGNKASEIEKNCKIKLGSKGASDLCDSGITDMFRVVQLSNGMVVTLSMAKEMGYVIK